MSKAGSKRTKSLLEQIADISDPRPKEFDIENDGLNDNAFAGHESGFDNDESDEEELKREHYVDVGKSTLRKRQGLGDLGPKYVGSRVSRKALYEDEEGDDSEDVDAESSGSELLDDGDEEDDKLDEEEEDEEESSMDNESEDDSDMDDTHFGFGAQSDSDDGKAESQLRVREEIKKLEEGEKALLKSITQTVRSDVEKGQHVLNQTRLWEGSLDARIRVQKIVTAANELPQYDLFERLVEARFEQNADSDEHDRLEEARQSIRLLIGSLVELRKSLAAQNQVVAKSQESVQAGSKRSAAESVDDEDEDDSGIVSTWNELKKIRSEFQPYRDESLEKWSNRVQISANVTNLKKFKAVNQGIMHQIGQALAAKDRLVERTQLKRTEYRIIGKDDADRGPINGKEDLQNEKNPSLVAADAHLKDMDAEIFDDTDFYQQLLRELIESRMVDSNDPTSALGVRWAAVRQQTRSKKRNVDTRASKGRKIRYHVMEKLQNFMPPIPAGTWHEDMVNELFSSLLGQKVPQSILDAEMDDDNSSTSKPLSVTESLVRSGEIDISDTRGLRLFG
ncbi:apoptosis-antagonizing transcription factor [Coemansia spiralis]|nr:apoptosis-antagonizing transcription factor [Coemansia spiralis]